MSDWVVRRATAADELAVRRVLDAATLERPPVADRIAVGRVAVAERDAVRGAVVAGPVPPAVRRVRPDDQTASEWHVESVAVARRQRDRGIGTALIEWVADRADRVTVRFWPSVTPFYRSLGFTVRETDDGCVGWRDG